MNSTNAFDDEKGPKDLIMESMDLYKLELDNTAACNTKYLIDEMYIYSNAVRW